MIRIGSTCEIIKKFIYNSAIEGNMKQIKIPSEDVQYWIEMHQDLPHR